MKLHITEVANIHQRGTCVQEFFIFYFFAIPPGMWDFISLTRDGNCAPCIRSSASSSLDHWGSPCKHLVECFLGTVSFSPQSSPGVSVPGDWQGDDDEVQRGPWMSQRQTEKKNGTRVLLTLGLEFLPLSVIVAHDKARETSSSVLKCPVFLVAESTVFITCLKSCCKENNNPDKFGWGLTLNTELLTMTRHGLRNVYQSFRDFGLILWHPLVPPGVAECSYRSTFPPGCFSCISLSLFFWNILPDRSVVLCWTMGNFLVSSEIHHLSLKIGYSLLTRWVFSIFV